MPTISLTDTTPGSISDANANLNNNWTLLENLLNGGLDNVNLAADAVGTSEIAADAVTAVEIAAGAVGNSELAALAVDNAKVATAAAIAVTKLAAGSNGAVLKTAAGAPAWSSVGGNGALLYNTGSDLAWSDTPADGETMRAVGSVPTWLPDPLRVYDVAPTAVDIVSSITETDIFSKSIAGNDMGTNKMLRLTIVGDFLNDTGAARSFITRIKFGGTTIYQDGSGSIAASANRRPWRVEMILANLNVTNAQMLAGQITLGTTIAPTTGLGDLETAPTIAHPIASAATNPVIDTTTAQTFAVSIELGFNSASYSFRKKYAILELLGT